MKKHKMEDSARVFTILGLVVEILALFVFIGLYMFTQYLTSITREEYIEAGWLPQDADLLLSLARGFTVVFIIVMILLGIMLIVNLYVFSKLIRGGFTESQARKIYLYQAVWGGVSLTFNTITGVFYLISAVQTHSRRYSISDQEE